jgi:hypothetical protein
MSGFCSAGSISSFAIVIVCAILYYGVVVNGDCAMQNFCNGHGTCVNSTSTCACYEGWGATSDIAFYKAPDCSQRVCPSDRAWSDVPTSTTSAHAVKECSNRGVCNRVTGVCDCFAGFTGSACQRNKCPNDCSGHGTCLSMKQLARMDAALPLGPNTYYEGDEVCILPPKFKISSVSLFFVKHLFFLV